MTSYKSQEKRIPNYFPSSFSEKKKKNRERGTKRPPPHNHVVWISKEQDRSVVNLGLES